MALVVLGREVRTLEQEGENGWSREFLVYCPQCKALQTVSINRDGKTSTRKFLGKNGQIYHDCGATRACRLYRL